MILNKLDYYILIHLRELRDSTIAPALFSALTPVSPYLLHPCSRTYGRPALVRGDHFFDYIITRNCYADFSRLKHRLITNNTFFK